MMDARLFAIRAMPYSDRRVGDGEARINGGRVHDSEKYGRFPLARGHDIQECPLRV